MSTVSSGSRGPRPAPGTTLIGVAIAVPAPHDAFLRERRAAFGDPLAATVPAHITLLPPTVVPTADLVAIDQHLVAVAASIDPFTVGLRGTDTFRPVSPVVFVRVADGADVCRELEALVRSGPLARDLDFPYHPHVTVAHHVPEPDLDRAVDSLADYDVSFEVVDFGRYEQRGDGVWESSRMLGLGTAGLAPTPGAR